jgi:hypothetical protein
MRVDVDDEVVLARPLADRRREHVARVGVGGDFRQFFDLHSGHQ